MSNIKHYLHQLEEEEQAVWMSYLEWLEENEEVFKPLTKNINDKMEEEK